LHACLLATTNYLYLLAYFYEPTDLPLQVAPSLRAQHLRGRRGRGPAPRPLRELLVQHLRHLRLEQHEQREQRHPLTLALYNALLANLNPSSNPSPSPNPNPNQASDKLRRQWLGQKRGELITDPDELCSEVRVQ
jgi:hypothetical protein